MRKFWGRQVPKLTCQELVELVTDYAEGDLPPEMQARFEEHLRACDGCTAYVEQMTRTLELTGSLTEESMSTDAQATLLQAFRDWHSGGNPVTP
jgi:anti-sigma factor RsiW